MTIVFDNFSEMDPRTRLIKLYLNGRGFRKRERESLFFQKSQIFVLGKTDWDEHIGQNNSFYFLNLKNLNFSFPYLYKDTQTPHSASKKFDEFVGER